MEGKELRAELFHNKTEECGTVVYEELLGQSVVENMMYESVVYKELLDESVVETVMYEAVNYTTVSLLSAGMCPTLSQLP